MKLITRYTDYAVRALCFIVKENQEVVSVSDLVKRLKIPGPFLRKILQALNTEGILNSYKGQGGGFTLARRPEKIFLVDLIEIFQGAFKLNECFFKKKDCPNTNTCPLKKKIDSIEKYVTTELKSITIASLLRG
ncbi:MAG: Rrf2 family transcriptional regulator [Candidatus Omnitrophica bacterium]|nr:Rrf2 family transcriptional regulator [Candidatus Omnitrophota bacterium]MDD5352963.1 Rrf2 family transcriptional regulator [Candidatus Omnitrophota bacterium]MDD5550562.1 Rrf2 family transcriptional regulator [Candidatus Omnitrophota bacterium]